MNLSNDNEPLVTEVILPREPKDDDDPYDIGESDYDEFTDDDWDDDYDGYDYGYNPDYDYDEDGPGVYGEYDYV